MATRYHKFYFYKPNPAAVEDFGALTATQILAKTWNQACIIDADFEGQWDEEDVTDSCSDGVEESQFTILSSSISLNGFKKRAADDTLPTWLVDCRSCFKNRDPIFALMLDGAKTVPLSDGVWLLAGVKQFKQTHKTKGGNAFDIQIKAYGAISGIKKFDFIQVPA